jgi:AcrR family transcriptional regulator
MADPSAASAAPLGRRAQNRIDREQGYLDAAMAIATSEGMGSLTMARLARDVDAAVGSVYTYFPSKGALVAEMQRVAIERLTASYHLTRQRSDAALVGWEPAPAAIARLVVFGRFWVETVHAFPREASFLHSIISVSEVFVPPEERYRVLPSALALLDEARRSVAEACEVGAIAADEPVDLVIRLAAGMTGVLLTANLGPGGPIAFDPPSLARRLQRELLLGWGASADAVARAEAHADELAATGPLAPNPER